MKLILLTLLKIVDSKPEEEKAQEVKEKGEEHPQEHGVECPSSTETSLGGSGTSGAHETVVELGSFSFAPLTFADCICFYFISEF